MLIEINLSAYEKLQYHFKHSDFAYCTGEYVHSYTPVSTLESFIGNAFSSETLKILQLHKRGSGRTARYFASACNHRPDVNVTILPCYRKPFCECNEFGTYPAGLVAQFLLLMPEKIVRLATYKNFVHFYEEGVHWVGCICT